MLYIDAVAQAEAEGTTVYDKYCLKCEFEWRCEGNIGFEIPGETQGILKGVLGRITDNYKKRDFRRPKACTSDGDLCPYAGKVLWEPSKVYEKRKNKAGSLR